MAYQHKKEGVFYDPDTGRTMEHYGYAKRIYWSPAMTDYLTKHYPTTTNNELAGCLGVSMRTLSRKAKELGLEKDGAWLAGIFDENRRIGRAVSRKSTNRGWFKKGQHGNPEGEFKKGHKPSEEFRLKISEGLKAWYRRNPDKAKAKAARIREAKRKKSASASPSP